MAQTSRFFDSVSGDRLYNSEEFSEYFEVLVDTGLIVGALNQLNPTVTGSNMIVTVDPGNSFINGRFYENDSSLDNTFDTETLGNDRIDLLVLRLDLNVGARIIDFQIVKGTPSATPVAPTVTRDSTIHELALAEVFITGGQSFIQSGDLTDLREITTQASFFFPSASSKVLPSIDQTAVDDNTERVAKYGTTTGSANAYLLTVNDVTAYFDGLLINIKANFTNTGSSTIDVNGLGVKNIFFKGSAIPTDYIISGQQYKSIYDGTQFNIMNTPEDFGEADDILTKIKTVDGIDSGLDTDLWRGFKIYKDLPELGLTAGTETIKNILTNMDINSISYLAVGASFNTPEYPTTLGYFSAIKGGSGRTIVEFKEHLSNDKWVARFINTSFDFGSWDTVVTLAGMDLRNNSGILEQSTDGIIWKAVGGVKNIQRGFEASIGAGATVDKTLTSVVTNKTMANLLSSIGRGSAGTQIETISIQLLNSTTLRIINNGIGIYNNISWEVIEYN